MGDEFEGIPKLVRFYICIKINHIWETIFWKTLCGLYSESGAHKEGRGEGKEHEAPTYLIKISEFTHAARVTKNSQTTRYVAKKN